jgi:hypothetical protein
MSETLGEALPREIARVRDEVLPEYIAIGPPGMLGAMLIRANLDAASKAMIEGDIEGMIAAYRALKEIKS